MVIKKICYLVLLACSVSFAQIAISGKIRLDDKNVLGQKVYLGKVGFVEGEKITKEVAWSPVLKDGSFSFQGKYISDKESIYRLYADPVVQVINDTILRKQDVILSKYDTVLFSNGLAGPYENSNLADAEWHKMIRFEARIKQEGLAQGTAGIPVEDTISKAYAEKLKAYTKDSLKILLVKLIGTRQLAKKGLLDKDIRENPNYYMDFLSALEKSDMEPVQYRFLSKRLAYLTQDMVERKYKRSKAINILLGVFVIGLSLFVYRLKKKQKVLVTTLSKQEKNVQALMLQGKSNKEIANELFISLSTVKTHITSIYSKLRIANRNELFKKMNTR